MGLSLAPDKIFGFNLPDGSGLAEAPEDFHFLGVPLRGVSKRVTKLDAVTAKLDKHDAVDAVIAGNYSRLCFDLAVGTPATVEAAVLLVTAVGARVGLSPDELPLPPWAAAVSCVLAARVRAGLEAAGITVKAIGLS